MRDVAQSGPITSKQQMKHTLTLTQEQMLVIHAALQEYANGLRNDLSPEFKDAFPSDFAARSEELVVAKALIADTDV